MLKLIVMIVLTAVTLYLLDRGLLWCESKGWIYYRKRKAGGANTALMGMAEFINPNASVVIEQLESEKRTSYQVNDNENYRRLKYRNTGENHEQRNSGNDDVHLS